MELSLVSESISGLLTVREYLSQISDLKQELSSLSSEFQNYKKKVKSSVNAFKAQYNSILDSKQHQIEQLQMQNSELNSILSTYASNQSNANSSKVSVRQNRFISLIKDQSSWNALKPYLNSTDLTTLLKVPSLKSSLLDDSELFDYLSQLLAAPIPIQDEVEVPAPAEQQDVNLLLEKYVNQQYTIGKGLEKKLTEAVPTLIRLFKSTGNTMPNQKFNTVAELILNIFPYDIVLELLIKSSSAFSKNSGSMNEWLSFLQNLLAGLISESSLVYSEVTELTKLKDILADKLRKAKIQMKSTERENIFLKDEVKGLRQVKDHLVARLHLTEIRLIEKAAEIQKFKEELEKVQKGSRDLEEYIALLKKSENGRMERVNLQMEGYKSQIGVLSQQKEELILAFEDLGTVFKSFSLR